MASASDTPLFVHLRSEWHFDELDDGCRLHFLLDLQLRSVLHRLSSPIAPRASMHHVPTMVPTHGLSIARTHTRTYGSNNTLGWLMSRPSLHGLVCRRSNAGDGRVAGLRRAAEAAAPALRLLKSQPPGACVYGVGFDRNGQRASSD